MNKTRLDILLTERGLTESRERAKALIMSGSVFVNGAKAEKAGMQAGHDATVEITAAPVYVSRGGLKLEKALDYFKVSPDGKVCVDCGASTGGFTDCLLKNGARHIYAIDVGYGQLAWQLRKDERVTVMERTNIRNVTADMLDMRPEFAVADVSFISLGLVLPVIRKILAEQEKPGEPAAAGNVICLIKPQFEAGRGKVGKKGVVREPQTHIEVLEGFIQNADKSGFSIKGLTHSPVKGPEGNIEYLGWLSTSVGNAKINIKNIVSESHEGF